MASKTFLNKTGLAYLWGKITARIPTKTSDITNDSGYITGTSYATANTGGTVKVTPAFGVEMSGSGELKGRIYDASEYNSMWNDALVSKGTMDVAFAGKLSSSVTSTSTNLAATPSAVRTAYHNGAWYATCATAAATVAKVGTCADFSDAGGLVAGAHVTVKFTNANTAASPTLNINSTGAVPIYINGAAATSGAWKAGDVKEFVYDGTNWVMTGGAPNIHYGTSAPANTVGSNGDIYVVYSD